jgi:hypothetical protein
MTIADQETIDWIASSHALPDDHETVLTNAPACGEPVWLGWYDGGTWHQVDGGEIAFPVTHWAKMPRGAFTAAKDSQHE